MSQARRSVWTEAGRAMPRAGRPTCLVAAAVWALVPTGPAAAQTLSQRGFVEAKGLAYPQEAPGDPTRAVGSALVRYEAAAAPVSWLTVAAGLDVRADSQGNVEHRWRVDWSDRSTLRPAAAVRRLSALATRGGFNLEVGKQFIRWGKADIVNPTDRFAPRDFMEVVVNDFMAVTAARATYERKGKTIDLVWSPRMTPSRLPRPDRRWSTARQVTDIVAIVDGGRELPAGAQAGARWSHVAEGFEYSVSVYEGFNHLPSVEQRLRPRPLALEIVRVFPRIRMYGADAAYPLRWLTLKGEAAVFTSRDDRADEYLSYVLQAERQAGEWLLVGGYTGERVTRRGSAGVFAPDRGLSGSFLGRVTRTIDANRSAAFEGAVRQNGRGAWLKGEFTSALGDHLRATIGATLITGRQADFLGQFRRNSHAAASLRYSF